HHNSRLQNLCCTHFSRIPENNRHIIIFSHKGTIQPPLKTKSLIIYYSIYQQSELDYLIYNAPLKYAYKILNGNPEQDLKDAALYKHFES
ncbi:MAG: hypothetical protein IKY52_00515, partial [Clostridia bacterium]|nr:hypothetical protein [Clostridia bacterium]